MLVRVRGRRRFVRRSIYFLLTTQFIFSFRLILFRVNSIWGIMAKLYIARLFRIFVSVVFLAAAGSKLIDPSPTTKALVMIGVSSNLAFLFVFVLLFVELVIGASLLVVSRQEIDSIAAIWIFGLFTFYLCYLLTLKSPPQCGCGDLLTMFADAKNNAIFGICRNLLLAIGLFASLKVQDSTSRNIGEFYPESTRN